MRLDELPPHTRKLVEAKLKDSAPADSPKMVPGKIRNMLLVNDELRHVVCRVVPMGKPRMTRRDKWMVRPAVARYREFSDALRKFFEMVPLKNISELSWEAYIPMPESWSAKKKALMSGTPHRTKPDRDNIDKAILDSLFDDDSGIYTGKMTKLWDDGGGPRIEVWLD